MPDPEVCGLVQECMHLLATCLPAPLLAEPLLARLEDSSADTPVQAGMLDLLAALLRCGGPSWVLGGAWEAGA